MNATDRWVHVAESTWNFDLKTQSIFSSKLFAAAIAANIDHFYHDLILKNGQFSLCTHHIWTIDE